MKRVVFAMLTLFVCSSLAWADQVILDDLIVDGSICVGQDCVNGESFGFDTIRLKENNLRIRFVDTSNSASFPSNDWQITINDSSNGGANKFSIEDITGGRTPFTIEAGAPSHSLYVDDGGRLGLGTSTPVVDAHIKSGNTPTVRLEQDGSSGFTPQTWDVAGNEAGFFIRDVTNGSTLPFRIRPGAPASAIDIASDGDVGIGTGSPDARLHIDTNDFNEPSFLINDDGSGGADFIVTEAGDVGIGTATPAASIHVVGRTSLFGPSPLQTLNIGASGGEYVSIGNNAVYDNGVANTYTYGGTDKASLIRFGNNGGMEFLVAPIGTSGNAISFINAITIDTAGDVGIGTTSPAEALHVIGNILASGTVTPSDAKFKTNVTPLRNMLEKLKQIRGVSFEWNETAKVLGHSTGQRDIGVIAQEVEAVFPELVTTWGNEGYKAVDYGKLTGALIEAVKELHAENVAQHQRIAALEARFEALEQSVGARSALGQLSLFNFPGDWLLFGGLSLVGLVLVQRWRKQGA